MRKSLTLSVYTVAAVSVATAALAQDNRQSLAPTQMKAALTSYFDAMNIHATETLISMFSPDAMIEDPVGGTLRTPTQFFTRLTNAKFTFEIAEMTATDANTAAVAVHIHNVSRGSIKNGTLNAIEIFSFKPDGKLAGMKAYWSVEDLAASQ